MEKEKTPWGIMARSKNNYILKIFTTGDGKKTGRVCDTYNDEDHQTMINQLVAAGVDDHLEVLLLEAGHLEDFLDGGLEDIPGMGVFEEGTLVGCNQALGV
jgi:hypothetical protein